MDVFRAALSQAGARHLAERRAGHSLQTQQLQPKRPGRYPAVGPVNYLCSWRLVRPCARWHATMPCEWGAATSETGWKALAVFNYPHPQHALCASRHHSRAPPLCRPRHNTACAVHLQPALARGGARNIGSNCAQLPISRGLHGRIWLEFRRQPRWECS